MLSLCAFGLAPRLGKLKLHFRNHFGQEHVKTKPETRAAEDDLVKATMNETMQTIKAGGPSCRMLQARGVESSDSDRCVPPAGNHEPEPQLSSTAQHGSAQVLTRRA